MSSKVLMLFALLCLLGSCCGAEETTQSITRQETSPIEPVGVSSDPDPTKDATFWRFWKFWNWAGRMKRFQYPTDTSRPKKITFTKNKYSTKTKVCDWTYETFAERRDNYVYRDHLDNHVSTYNRLGTEDVGCRGGTETQNMLKQIFTRTEAMTQYKPLVNFTSYPCTDTPERNKMIDATNLERLDPDFGKMDYLSTYADEFRNPCPTAMKPLTMRKEPWMLNRIVSSDFSPSNVPPPGMYMYNDIHTSFANIRRLRLKRQQSWDPATCNKNFPDVAITDESDVN